MSLSPSRQKDGKSNPDVNTTPGEGSLQVPSKAPSLFSDRSDISGGQSSIISPKVNEDVLLLKPSLTGGIQNPLYAKQQLSSHQKHFLQYFPELEDEVYYLRGTASCSVEKDSTWHGRIFYTKNYLCFHGKHFSKSTKLELPWADVLSIEKKSVAGIFPNAIKVSTLHSKFVFSTFMKRDTVFGKLTALWSDCVDPQNKCHETVLAADDDSEVTMRVKSIGRRPRSPDRVHQLQSMSNINVSTTSLASVYSLPDYSVHAPHNHGASILPAEPLFHVAEQSNPKLDESKRQFNSDENLSIALFGEEGDEGSVVVVATDALLSRTKTIGNSADPRQGRGEHMASSVPGTFVSGTGNAPEKFQVPQPKLLDKADLAPIDGGRERLQAKARRARSWFSDNTHPVVRPFIALALLSWLLSLWTSWRFHGRLNIVAQHLDLSPPEVLTLLDHQRWRPYAGVNIDNDGGDDAEIDLDWNLIINQHLSQSEEQRRHALRRRLHSQH